MRARLLIALLWLWGGVTWGQCSGTAYGSYTCITSCGTYGFGQTTRTCALSSIAAGDFLYVRAQSLIVSPATMTITAGTGCGTVTQGAPLQTGTGTASYAHAVASGTSCTLTVTTSSSAALAIIGVAVRGSNNMIDQESVDTNGGYIAANTTINAPTKTTTVNGDLVISSFVDFGGNSGTYTAGSGTLAKTQSYGLAIQQQPHTTAGAVSPSLAGYTNGGAHGTQTTAIEPSAGVAVRRKVVVSQ